MYNYYFQIAGLTFDICSPAPVSFQPCMRPFQLEYVKKANVSYQLEWQIEAVDMGHTISKDGFSVFREDGRFVRIKNIGTQQGLTTVLLKQISLNYYQMQIPVKLLQDNQLFVGANILNFLALEDGLLAHQAFILHSSFISWNGKGILFTAPSGTGKSTQADLWKQYEGADIYNGDRTIVRKIDGKFIGFGSPYAGSSGIYRNESAPICAIVVLTQAPENQIQRLSGKQAFLPLFRETLANTWNPAYMERMTDLLMDAAASIPIFHLTCRPDQDAVNTVKQTILFL